MESTFENLYPSLVQCFTVILVGYCVGRLGFISPTSSKGIGVFVSLVSLPALLFKSMVELDYSQVNWRFLFSILIAKSTVFFSVAIFTSVLIRPTNLGKAGMYGIFCSQSNDLALGLPLGNDNVGFVRTPYPPFCIGGVVIYSICTNHKSGSQVYLVNSLLPDFCGYEKLHFSYDYESRFQSNQGIT